MAKSKDAAFVLNKGSWKSVRKIAKRFDVGHGMALDAAVKVGKKFILMAPGVYKVTIVDDGTGREFYREEMVSE